MSPATQIPSKWPKCTLESNNSYHCYSLPKVLDYLFYSKCLKAFKALWFFLPHRRLICKPLWHKQEICLAHLWGTISHSVPYEKILRKARPQLIKDLLKHLWLDKAKAATTAQPLGRLNSTLGKHEEMEEMLCIPTWIASEINSHFLIDEKCRVFWFCFYAFYSILPRFQICSSGDSCNT